ncbi:unnamed protein product, partial [Mesorhabditis belari]|uniref:RNase H type-1 domain-containing protein n=1 Tax=Mesorhabditis belari TaxID=2138241 RepID=A0AAF3EU00_9BILA
MDALWNLENSQKKQRTLKKYDLKGNDTKNLQNLQLLLSCFPKGDVTLQWVQSHVGDCGNNKADELARDAIKLLKGPKDPKGHPNEPKKIKPWKLADHQITFGNDEESPFEPQEIQYDKDAPIAEPLNQKKQNLLMDIVREINKDWDMQ